ASRLELALVSPRSALLDQPGRRSRGPLRTDAARSAEVPHPLACCPASRLVRPRALSTPRALAARAAPPPATPSPCFHGLYAAGLLVPWVVDGGADGVGLHVTRRVGPEE